VDRPSRCVLGAHIVGESAVVAGLSTLPVPEPVVVDAEAREEEYMASGP
jgi:hypothetical protein